MSYYFLAHNEYILQLYHDENKLHVAEINGDDDDARLLLHQQAELDLYSTSSLEQQIASMHVVPSERYLYIKKSIRHQFLTKWCKFHVQMYNHVSPCH